MLARNSPRLPLYVAAASSDTQRRTWALGARDAGGIAVRQFPVRAARFMGSSIFRHEQRHLMSLIKIIEIHEGSLLVSGSAVCLSAVWAYKKTSTRSMLSTTWGIYPLIDYLLWAMAYNSWLIGPYRRSY